MVLVTSALHSIQIHLGGSHAVVMQTLSQRKVIKSGQGCDYPWKAWDSPQAQGFEGRGHWRRAARALSPEHTSKPWRTGWGTTQPSRRREGQSREGWKSSWRGIHKTEGRLLSDSADPASPRKLEVTGALRPRSRWQRAGSAARQAEAFRGNFWK